MEKGSHRPSTTHHLWPVPSQPGTYSSNVQPTIICVSEYEPRRRIHNAYMLASAWKLVLDTLGELQEDGLGDRTAQADLKKHEDLRSRYLVLYDMVGKLIEIGQNKFSVLATTTRQWIPILNMTSILTL
jgi:hypothetical protein